MAVEKYVIIHRETHASIYVPMWSVLLDSVVKYFPTNCRCESRHQTLDFEQVW